MANYRKLPDRDSCVNCQHLIASIRDGGLYLCKLYIGLVKRNMEQCKSYICDDYTKKG